jgi:hypothetical protein
MHDREIELIGERFGPDVPNANNMVEEAAHYMNIFTFHETTPASRVGNYIKENFFRASGEHGLPILTNKGVRYSKEARLGHKDIQFLTQTALVTTNLASLAKDFIERLQGAGILKVAGWEDVLVELSARSLNETEGKQFLRWLLNEKPSDEIKNMLLSGGKLIFPNGKTVSLGQVKSYIVRGRFPVQGELPQTVLPPEVSQHFQPRELGGLYEFLVLILLNAAGAGKKYPCENG